MADTPSSNTGIQASDIPAALTPGAPNLPSSDLTSGHPGMELLDIKQNAVVKVPTENAADLLRTGLYAPKKGQYQVVNDNGETYDVESHALADTLRTPGTRFETSDEQRRRESQEKYGHQSLRTFGESAASAATFGASTALETGFGVPAADIEGRREANPASNTAGQIAGVAAPLVGGLIPGAAGKAVAAAGFGPTLAAKAGGAVEKTLAKTFMSEGASQSLAKTIAGKLASNAAGSAVEGSLYGAGTLLDEHALGRADINAENFLATVGPAALIGAGAGVALKGIELAANPVLKFSSKQIANLAENLADKNSAAVELMGVSGSKASKLKASQPEIHAGSAEYLKQDLKLGPATTADELATRNTGILDSSGEKINNVVNRIDETLKDATFRHDGGRLEARDFWNRAGNKLRGLVEELPEGVGANAPRNSVMKLIGEADDLAKSGGMIKAAEINTHKSQLESLIDWGKQASESPVKQQALRELHSMYRDTLEELAFKAESAGNPGLLKELQQANLKNHFAKTFDEALRMKADKAGEAFGLKTMLGAGVLGHLDYGLGAAYAVGREVLKSDLKRKAVVLMNLEKAGQTVNKVVNSAVKNFSTNVRTLELPVRTTIQDHVLSKNLETNKKATDKQAAMRNIQDNLLSMVENQEQLANRVNRATSTFYKAAPETSTAMDAYGINAVNFLSKKLPNKGTNPGVFGPFKKPRFSDMEIHKFEKYLEAVETPLQVVKKLEHGQINREHVEALKTVYPQIYQKLQTSIMDSVSKNPDAFSYNKKVQLSILLGQPTDASLQPEHIAGLQMNFAPKAQDEQSGRGAVKTSQTGLDKLKYSNRNATETQEPSTLDEA